MSRVLSQGVMKVSVQDGDLDKHQLKLARVTQTVEKLKNSQAQWWGTIEKNNNRMSDLTREIEAQNRVMQKEAEILTDLRQRQEAHTASIVKARAMGVENEREIAQLEARKAEILARSQQLIESRAKATAKAAEAEIRATATNKTKDISAWDRQVRAVERFTAELAQLRQEEIRLMSRNNALLVSQNELSNEVNKSNSAIKTLGHSIKAHGNTAKDAAEKVRRLGLAHSALGLKNEAAAGRIHETNGKIKDLNASMTENEEKVRNTSRLYSSYISVVTKVGITVMLLKQAFDMARKGAESLDLEKTLGYQIGNFETKLADIRKATAGTVDDLTILKSTALMSSFGLPMENIDKQMELVTKMSIRTGQSTDYLMESLARGISRLSPLILDNLGIQVDLTDAYDAYAVSVGKSVDSLTKLEKQAAVTADVMGQLEKNTEGIALNESAASSMDRLSTKAKNVWHGIGEGLASVVMGVSDLVEWTSAVKGGFEQTRESARQNNEELQKTIQLIQNLKGQGINTEAQERELDALKQKKMIMERFPVLHKLATAEYTYNANILDELNALELKHLGYRERLNDYASEEARNTALQAYWTDKRIAGQWAYLAVVEMVKKSKESESLVDKLNLSDAAKKTVIAKLQARLQDDIKELISETNSLHAKDVDYLKLANDMMISQNSYVGQLIKNAQEYSDELGRQGEILNDSVTLYQRIAKEAGRWRANLMGVSKTAQDLSDIEEVFQKAQERQNKAQEAYKKDASLETKAELQKASSELATLESKRQAIILQQGLEENLTRVRKNMHEEYMNMGEKELAQEHKRLEAVGGTEAATRTQLNELYKLAQTVGYGITSGAEYGPTDSVVDQIVRLEDHLKRLEETEVKLSRGRKARVKKEITDFGDLFDLMRKLRLTGQQVQQNVFEQIIEYQHSDFSTLVAKYSNEIILPVIESAFAQAEEKSDTLRRIARKLNRSFAEAWKAEVSKVTPAAWFGASPIEIMLKGWSAASSKFDYGMFTELLGDKNKAAAAAEFLAQQLQETFTEERFGKDIFKAVGKFNLGSVLFGDEALRSNANYSEAIAAVDQINKELLAQFGMGIEALDPALAKFYARWKDLQAFSKNVSETFMTTANAMKEVAKGAEFFELIDSDAIGWLNDLTGAVEGFATAMGSEANGYNKFLASLPILRSFTKALVKEKKAQAGVEAVMQSAAAFAAAGSGNYIAMAAHIQAATLYGLIAGGVVKLPSTAKDPEKDKTNGSGSKRGDLHFHVYGNIVGSQAELGVMVNYALQQARAEGAI